MIATISNLSSARRRLSLFSPRARRSRNRCRELQITGLLVGYDLLGLVPEDLHFVEQRLQVFLEVGLQVAVNLIKVVML
jgi:hypothetical protein